MIKSIKLKWIFKDSGQTGIANILTNVRERLESNVQKAQAAFDVSSIQTMLNDIFYPAEGISQNSLAEQYQNEIIEELSKTIATSFQNFDLATAARSKNIHATTTVSHQRFQNTIQKTYNSLKAIEEAIRCQQGSPVQLTNLKLIKSQIENTLNQAQQVKQQYEKDYTLKGTLRKQYRKGSVGSQVIQLLKEMEAFNQAVYNGKNVNKTKLGSIFEKYLAIATQDFYDSSINDMYHKITSVITGGNQVSRGVWKGKKIDGVSYSMNINEINMSETKLKEQGFKISKDGTTITYAYQPGEEKQAKMDVQIDYRMGNRPNVINSIRASAKNWGGKTRSIGETSIDAALNRAVGTNITEYYKLAMLNPKYDQYKEGNNVSHTSAQAGHDLAQLALLSDIIMGLNQGEPGMANVLIINTGSHIRVIDISQIILKWDKTNGSLIGYNNKNIESEAHQRYSVIRQVAQGNRTNSYLGLMTSTLNKMKVSCILSQGLLEKI